jgi:hypothetical protein
VTGSGAKRHDQAPGDPAGAPNIVLRGVSDVVSRVGEVIVVVLAG